MPERFQRGEVAPGVAPRCGRCIRCESTGRRFRAAARSIYGSQAHSGGPWRGGLTDLSVGSGTAGDPPAAGQPMYRSRHYPTSPPGRGLTDLSVCGSTHARPYAAIGPIHRSSGRRMLADVQRREPSSSGNTHGPLAQGSEQGTFNPRVVGSNPTRPSLPVPSRRRTPSDGGGPAPDDADVLRTRTEGRPLGWPSASDAASC